MTTADTAATAAIPALSATAPSDAPATAPSAAPTTAPLAELADVVARFTALVSRRLPDDVTARLKALAEEETNPMAMMIYRTMQRNQELAERLRRPSCQDTGLVQIFVTVGSRFPHTDGLTEALKAAIAQATRLAPLRHNTVETFDEFNTGTNVGTKSPWIYWDVAEGRDDLALHVYLAGGGCSLPGQGRTLMPGEGYEAAMKFVLDVMTSYGINACPPLLVGVGIGSSIDAAAGRTAGATPMERQEAEGLERTAAHHITLTTPISREDIEDIRVGNVVFLGGRITTCRDVAHRRLIKTHQVRPRAARGHPRRRHPPRQPIIRVIDEEANRFEVVAVGPGAPRLAPVRDLPGHHRGNRRQGRPMGALSIIAMAAYAATGVLAPDGDAGDRIAAALSGLSNSTIWLIVSAFFAARASAPTWR